MNRKNIIPLMLGLSGLLLLTGCKPTEKNYKAAYDAALSKRQAEKSDPDLNLPAGVYQRLDEPGKRDINGKSYPYQFVRLKPLDADWVLDPYCVAVAVYKMPTNCQAQVHDLREAGFKAFGAKAADDRYYVFIAGYETIEDAAANVDKYVTKNKDAVYVGLPESPVIIRTK